MPRDLHAIAQENSLQTMPALTKSPEEVDDHHRSSAMDAADEDEMIGDLTSSSSASTRRPNGTKRDQLHPYTQALSVSDVDSCTRLEEETFPPHERATREKFQYRLTHCGDISLGIYTSHSADDIPTAPTASPIYSGAPTRKAVLLGHLIATKTTHPTVTDADMAIPSPSPSSTTTTSNTPTTTTSSSSSNPPNPEKQELPGHREQGRTLCIHSLAVLPAYQRRGLGRTLLTAYLQRMESHGIADRAALLTHEALIPYYESFGFRNLGRSEASFGGGGWFDMVKELSPEKEMGGLS